MASKLYDYTPTELQKLLDESNSYADLLRKIGMSEHGANRLTLRKIINEYNLDLTKLSNNRQQGNLQALHKIHQKKTKLLTDILQKDTSYKSSNLLKRLFNEGYKEKRCECCGITTWMGKEITFQLHHKDGDHHNNEIDNLEVLCPNCHSQTDNFAGRGTRKIPTLPKEQEKRKAQRGISEDGQRYYDGYGNYKILCPICQENFMNKEATMCKECYDKDRKKPKVSKEDLLSIIKENTYTSAASLLGVDRKTVSKWCRYYNIEDKVNNIIIEKHKAPTREMLKEKIRTMPFVQIGKEYEVSDNTIRRWCDIYGLPKRSSDIKKMSEEEWEML